MRIRYHSTLSEPDSTTRYLFEHTDAQGLRVGLFPIDIEECGLREAELGLALAHRRAAMLFRAWANELEEVADLVSYPHANQSAVREQGHCPRTMD